MIKINYTAYMVNDWGEILSYHISRIKPCILEKYESRMKIFCHPYSDKVHNIIKKFGIEAEIVKIPENRYEFPAIYDLIDNFEDINLYMHSKGVTRPRDTCEHYWNAYMTHFNVDLCDKCISSIEKGHSDCSGVEFRMAPYPHYSGNFWWSSGEHLYNLHRSPLYNQINSRYIAEGLIGSIPGRYMSLCNSGLDLYHNEFREESWIEEKKIYSFNSYIPK